MSLTINQVTLQGNVGRMPRRITLPSGAKVCHVLLATDELEQDWRSGAARMVTQWHRVVLAGPLALGLCGQIAKGDAMRVEGRMRSRKWTDRHGVTRYLTEVLASAVRIYPKPGRASPAIQAIQKIQECGAAQTDPGIAAWVAAYDAAEAGALAASSASAGAMGSRRKGGLQGRRLPTCGGTGEPGQQTVR